MTIIKLILILSSSPQADGKAETSDKVVGSKRGTPGARVVYRTKFSAEPDILRDVGSLSLGQ